jgi:cGMP-dependent protein kinase 1
VIENMKVLRYSDCKVVIQPGTMCGSKLIIVLRGGLRYKNTTIAEVFDCIGEKSMEDYKGETYNDVVTSKGDTYIAEIDKIEYEKCIGNRFITGIMSPEAMNTLKNIQILRSLPEDKFQLLAMRLKTQEFDDKNVIIEQNTPGTNFFIIGSGKVDIVQDGTILRTVTKHDYFGERSILNNNHRTASVIANGQVSCWYLSSNDFMEILEESARTLLLKRIELQDDSITLNDLCIVKLLGKGMFGNVFLVVDKKKHRLYALKTVSRNKILKYEIQENLKLERTILLRLDHLFILKLVKTFKDDQRIYLLTELVKGSDLFDVLRDLNIVTDSEAKFYVACLVVILEYLHDRDIIYRDLKPENIIIDEEGYTKLIDFGISKILNGRTYTIVGTPHYMAPEVIVGKGYNFLADYWSLGVMLYEFLFCSVPFGENEEDPYKVYQKVLEMKLTFPNYLTLKSDTKAMIEQLTSKNPVSRNGGSVQNLKSNPWFSTINWDMLTAKEIPAPYKPKVVDLTQDIETALKNNSSIEKIILKEEIPDFEDNANRRRKKIPNDWDEEF